MFNKFWGLFSTDIGVDLGTSNTLVYVKGHGVAINEPSVVAINQKTKQILSIGQEARQMVGRTPAHIVAVKPLVDGVISDFEITESMLKYFIRKVHRGSLPFAPRPRLVIGIPYSVTEVERRAVEEAGINAGGREVFLIEEPLAAAIGAGLPVQEAKGSMIVDIGGGTTEVAIIALGGIVASRSLRIAGNQIDGDIQNFAREEYSLLIGERTAEEIKLAVGSTIPLREELTVPMRGRDLVTGLPKEIIVYDEQIRQAISKSISQIVEVVKTTIEEAPPEIVADILENGIVLAGGGALLRGLDRSIQQSTEAKVYVAEDPLTSVVRGTGVVLEDLDNLRNVLLPTEFIG